MKPGSRVVYSTVDGDLRKARDPGLRERWADGDRAVRSGLVTNSSWLSVPSGGL